MKKVFYSPGPYCNTDVYEVVDFGDWTPTEEQLADDGYQMAVDHYERYVSYDEDDNDGMEPEYDYCWYNIDDPEVEGHI